MSFGLCAADAFFEARRELIRRLERDFATEEIPAAWVAVDIQQGKSLCFFESFLLAFGAVIIATLVVGVAMTPSPRPTMFPANVTICEMIVTSCVLSCVLIFVCSLLCSFVYFHLRGLLDLRRDYRKWQKLPLSAERKRVIWRRVEEIFCPPS